MTEPTWIMGSGGLPGRALSARTPEAFRRDHIPWEDAIGATRTLRSGTMAFAAAAGDAPWTIVWAVGTSDDEGVTRGLEQFRAAVNADREHLQMCAGHSRVVVGRFSNLYGTGQNFRKTQVLISQLCLASLTRRATSIYVPLETMRDYVYSEDADALAWRAIDAARRWRSSGPSVRVLCSGENATVVRLVDLVNRQGYHRPLLSLGVTPCSAHQLRDLRMRSLHAQERGHAVRTTLTVGVARVLRHTAELVRDGAVARATT